MVSICARPLVWAATASRKAWNFSGPSWTRTSFTLRQAPQRLTAHIDLQDDGWFAGRDNVYIEVDLAQGDDGQLAVTRTDKCTATAATADGVTTVTVDIPRPPLTEPLQSGGRVGIMPRFWNGVGTVAFLIDPFASLSITLE